MSPASRWTVHPPGTLPGNWLIGDLRYIEPWYQCTGEPLEDPTNWQPLPWKPQAVVHSTGTLAQLTDPLGLCGNTVILLPQSPSNEKPVQHPDPRGRGLWVSM